MVDLWDSVGHSVISPSADGFFPPTGGENKAEVSSTCASHRQQGVLGLNSEFEICGLPLVTGGGIIITMLLIRNVFHIDPEAEAIAKDIEADSDDRTPDHLQLLTSCLHVSQISQDL